jgi:hypothetical protein
MVWSTQHHYKITIETNFDLMASSPSSDREAHLKQRVWAGRLPVVFSLDPNEVTTLHAPRPFYVSCCRSATSQHRRKRINP